MKYHNFRSLIHQNCN